MSFKIFFVEIRRTWITCFSLFVLCFISGAVFLTSVNLSKYLASLFQEVNLGGDMIILPKTITPDSMQKSLINGQPEALMPLALFETLQSQAISETEHKTLKVPPVKLLAFLPFRNDDGTSAIAKIGDLSMIKNKEKTSWSTYSFKELADVKEMLYPKNIYFTEEWKDKTIFGILVTGEAEALVRLKQMIDRRTIAQAYILHPDHLGGNQKIEKLKAGLLYLTGIIIFSVLLGVIISFQKLHAQRDIIFRCLNELGQPKNLQIKIYILQIGVLILAPLLLGLFVSYEIFPVIKDLI